MRSGESFRDDPISKAIVERSPGDLHSTSSALIKLLPVNEEGSASGAIHRAGKGAVATARLLTPKSSRASLVNSGRTICLSEYALACRQFEGGWPEAYLRVELRGTTSLLLARDLIQRRPLRGFSIAVHLASALRLKTIALGETITFAKRGRAITQGCRGRNLEPL